MKKLLILLAAIAVLSVAAIALPQPEPVDAMILQRYSPPVSCSWHQDSNIWRPWPMVGSSERLAGQFYCPACGRQYYLVLPNYVLQSFPIDGPVIGMPWTQSVR